MDDLIKELVDRAGLSEEQAKAAGFPAQNCQYCHTMAMPKKEGFKPDELNERGKWLLSEKDKLKANEVKAEWLKTYPGGK